MLGDLQRKSEESSKSLESQLQDKTKELETATSLVVEIQNQLQEAKNEINQVRILHEEAISKHAETLAATRKDCEGE